DWKALQDFKGDGLRKPLSEERGGLGFYDLMKRQVRGRQANLAKQHGVHGFSYYHYWFGGEGGHNKSVMWKVPYQVLHDGQPNLPYFFTWANEPWTRKFSGQAGEAVVAVLLVHLSYWGAATGFDGRVHGNSGAVVAVLLVHLSYWGAATGFDGRVHGNSGV
ncbi:hypothetical protein AK812_SmicGene44713, partial [Symbiodinium microadriaticum]